MPRPRLCRVLVITALLANAAAVSVTRAQAQTGAPALSTLTATSGTVGGAFFIYVPLADTGTGTATSVLVQSITLGTAPLSGPTLPISIGTLTPGASYPLNLSFNDAALVAGKSYLLTIRGTYSAGGPTLGFAVNRIVKFGQPSIFQTPANPLTVTPTLDTAHAAKQSIVAANGGTITATGADGSIFTLTIPAKALLSDETITLTPVSALGGLPISNGLVAAVQFTPDGLHFEQAATLTIQPAVTVAVNQQVGFAYHGSGQEFYFQPLELTPAITIPIFHFSGVGVGQGTAGNGGTPTSLEDRLDSAEAPLLAQERANLFPNDPPANPQLQSESDGILQEYFDQVLQPLLEAAQTDDTEIQAALVGAIDFLQRVQNLNSQDPTLQLDVDTINNTVPGLVTKGYNDAFANCEGATSEGDRILQAQKMIWFFNAPEALGTGGAATFPDFKTQVATCLAAPLNLDFDTQVIGSGLALFQGGALQLNAEVSAHSVPMFFETGDMSYHSTGTATAVYDFLLGTITWPPPLFDCGSTFTGLPGPLDATGQFDLNFDPSAITDPSQLTINLTVLPDVSESTILAAAAPMAPCTTVAASTTFYLSLYLLGDGEGPTGGPLPFPVNLGGIPVPINLFGTVTNPAGIVTANITGTVTLTPTGP